MPGFKRAWNFDGAARQLSTSDLDQILDPESDMGSAIALALEGLEVTGNLPAGGTLGQVLAKNSNLDGDVEWVSVEFDPGEAGVPPGGTTGQVLRKNTGDDGDAAWATLPATNVAFTPGGSLAATTVQAAIAELRDEKAANSHSHAVSDVTNLQTTLDGKAALLHSHTSEDITDIDLTSIPNLSNGFYSVKYNTGTSTYPNRSSSGTTDPTRTVWWIGGPGPTKTGTGSTGAVTGDFYVAS